MLDIHFFALVLGFGFFAFFATMLLVTPFTNFLYKHHLGKKIRTHAVDGKESPLFSQLHSHKIGTPTMGGVLIWGAVLVIAIAVGVASVYFPQWFPDNFRALVRGQIYLPLFTLIATAILGLVDDFYNVKEIGNHKGLHSKVKAGWQFLFASVGAYWFFVKLGYDALHIPFVGDVSLGWLYIPLFIFCFVGTSNAVNITDGLDGLAGGLLIFAFLSMSVVCFLHGFLLLCVFCAVVSGALLTFLWFNIPPARFYMGDTGSLSLGATLAVIALMTNTVVLLPFFGFVFMIETLSVIIQLTSKKLRNGKKVFHIAPIHHHFEYIGWSESRVVMRAWVVGVLSCLLGLIVALLG